MAISGSAFVNQLLFQIISEGLEEQDSFSVLAPLASLFNIKHLGELLNVNDPEVPERDSGVMKDGLQFLPKRGARGQVNLNSFLHVLP